MSKAFVGNRVQTVDIGEELDKITRVILVVDSEHSYISGDDTGRTIEREIPWGSQEMADALLEKLSGVSYKPFSAERAMLSPAFEIGDPVNVGGVYSRIIGADINYGVSGLVDIYAPDLDVTDDEYPAEKTQQSSIARQLAATRALISKSSEEIRLEVFGEDGYSGSSIAAQLEEITAEVSGKINGDDANALIKTALDGIELSITNNEGRTTFKLTAEGSELTSNTFDLHVKSANIHGKLNVDQLNIAGQLTFGDFTEKVQSALLNIETKANDAAELTSAWVYQGTTMMDGSKLMTGTVIASQLLGGSVGLLASEGTVVGSLDLAYTSTGYGLGISTKYGGIIMSSAGNWWVDAAGGSMGITGSKIWCGVPPVPGNNTVTLGMFGSAWADIYTAYGTFSDLVARVETLEAKE